MTFRTAQPNFSRGEIAPDLYGRFDADMYAAGVKTARNVLILKYGGLTKRPGTQLVAEVIDPSEPTRLVPFQFSLTQTYALEMGQGYMSPCAFGGRLLETELAITDITNAAQAQVTVAYHALVEGDLFYITGLAGEMGDLLNGRAWPVVSIVDADNFTIDVDTTGVAAFTTCEGGITRTEAPTVPTPPVVPDPVPEPDLPDYFGGAGGLFSYKASFGFI